MYMIYVRPRQAPRHASVISAYFNILYINLKVQTTMTSEERLMTVIDKQPKQQKNIITGQITKEHKK